MNFYLNACILIPLLAVGCVSNSTYERLQAEVDAAPSTNVWIPRLRAKLHISRTGKMCPVTQVTWLIRITLVFGVKACRKRSTISAAGG